MPTTHMVASGAYRYKILIERPVEVVDEGGGNNKTWGEFANVWGHIQPASAHESYVAMSAQMSVTHIVEFRFLPGLRSEMRIKHDQRIFAIRGIRDIEERHRKHVLLCEEVKGIS